MSDDQLSPVADPFRLQNRFALVTGASGNIGQAIAQRLAAAGASVALHNFSDSASADWLEEKICSDGGNAFTLQADLRAEVEVQQMFDLLQARDWKLDCVVNNAAAQPVQMLADMSAEDWREVLAANLDSAFLVSRYGAESMQQRASAVAIVNIASIEGTDPARGHGHYASSKAGLIMQTRSFAFEYGAAGSRKFGFARAHRQ